VTDPLVPIGDGHTELTDDDREGLIPSYITTRGELNDAEQRNIVAATVRRRLPSADQLLDDKYLRDLHKAMLRDVWTWAGQYRKRETNIGVEPNSISVEVRTLTQDARAWIEHETYPPDEIAVRFHHRLVAIHPFANGNGRHSRITADYLVRALGQESFSWGANLDVSTDDLRTRYIAALHDADAGSMDALLAFARS
jgi:Fic-DOC domain mobile mystery protein B